jgi:hypothetical protein
MKKGAAWSRTAPLVAWAIWVALTAIIGSGCSGIYASKSISPIDFILPCLVQNAPATPIKPNCNYVPPDLAQVGHDLPSMKTHPNYLL